MRPHIRSVFFLFLVFFLGRVPAFAEEDFPARKLYTDVQVVELAQLASTQGESIVVDVRTPYEFDTIHIDTALNVPLSHADFPDKIKALRAESTRPIVFYCNGHTCHKSYEAARRAQAFGTTGVYAYDAGIFDWARAHPDRTVLLGRHPIDPARLISKEQHQARLLEPAEFEKRAGSPGYQVVDVRSRMQRSALGLFTGGEKWASLDDSAKLNDIIRQAQKEKKTLLIYDAVGKQVEWLEYRLRDIGMDDYYFMKSGAEGFYAYLGVPRDLLALPKK